MSFFQAGNVIDSNSEELEGEIVLTSQTRFCSVVTNFRGCNQPQPDVEFRVHTKDLAKVKANGDVTLVRFNNTPFGPPSCDI